MVFALQRYRLHREENSISNARQYHPFMAMRPFKANGAGIGGRGDYVYFVLSFLTGAPGEL
jgi:hypothetical protein